MIPDDARQRWLGPKPEPPPCRLGDTIQCEINGDCIVTMWHDRGEVQWPKGRPVGKTDGRGGQSIIITPELAAAIRLESELAIRLWLVVSKYTVRQWRRALDVPRHNPGTIALRQAETGDPELTAERNRTTHPNLWTPEEDALLGTMPDQELATQLGRPVNGVRSRRLRLGIKVKPWGLRGNRRRSMALQRQRDRKDILDGLLAQQDGRCHWCGVPIVRVASIPPEGRLAVRANTVVIATPDGEVTRHVATLDHLEAPGVLNGVASCATCNRTRAERPKTFERWLERRRKMVRNFKPGR